MVHGGLRYTTNSMAMCIERFVARALAWTLVTRKRTLWRAVLGVRYRDERGTHS